MSKIVILGESGFLGLRLIRPSLMDSLYRLSIIDLLPPEPRSRLRLFRVPFRDECFLEVEARLEKDSYQRETANKIQELFALQPDLTLPPGSQRVYHRPLSSWQLFNRFSESTARIESSIDNKLPASITELRSEFSNGAPQRCHYSLLATLDWWVAREVVLVTPKRPLEYPTTLHDFCAINDIVSEPSFVREHEPHCQSSRACSVNLSRKPSTLPQRK
jgi:hypothetical protein